MVPEGMTYEKYMEGYMLEILAHEMGHNLGLRHNFKGNLGAIDGSKEAGSVSRSVTHKFFFTFLHFQKNCQFLTYKTLKITEKCIFEGTVGISSI
jgi:hypothetical protein